MLEKILKPKKIIFAAALLAGLSGGFNKVQAGGFPTSFEYGKYFSEMENPVVDYNWLRDFLEDPSNNKINESWFKGYKNSGIELDLGDIRQSVESFAKGINEPQNFMKYLIEGADTEEKALLAATLGGGYILSIANSDSNEIVTSHEEEAKAIRDKTFYDKENNKMINCINSGIFQADVINSASKEHGLDLRAGTAVVFGSKTAHLVVPVRNLKSGEFFILDYDRFQRTGTWDLSEALALYFKDRKERVILGQRLLEINGYYHVKTKTQEEYERTVSPLGVLTEDFGSASLKNLIEKKFDDKNRINFYLDSYGYGVNGDFFFEKRPVFVNAEYGFSENDMNQFNTSDNLSNIPFSIFNLKSDSNNNFNKNIKPDFNFGGFSLFAEKKESIIPEYGDYESDFSSSKVGLKNKYGKIEMFKINVKDDRISMSQSFEGYSCYFGNAFPLFSDRFLLGFAEQFLHIQKSEENNFFRSYNFALDFIVNLKNGFYSTIGVDTDYIIKDIFDQRDSSLRIANLRLSAGIRDNLYNFGIEGKKHYADDSMEEVLYNEFKINFERMFRNFSIRGEFSDKSFKNGWDELYVDKRFLSLDAKWKINTNLSVNGEYSINEDIWRDLNKSQTTWKVGLEAYF